MDGPEAEHSVGFAEGKEKDCEESILHPTALKSIRELYGKVTADGIAIFMKDHHSVMQLSHCIPPPLHIATITPIDKGN